MTGSKYKLLGFERSSFFR